MPVPNSIFNNLPVVDEQTGKPASGGKSVFDALPVVEDKPDPAPVKSASKRPLPMSTIVNGGDPDEGHLNLDFINNAITKYTAPPSADPVVVPNPKGAHIYQANDKGVGMATVESDNGKIKVSGVNYKNGQQSKVSATANNAQELAQMTPSLEKSLQPVGNIAPEGAPMTDADMKRAQDLARQELNANQAYLGGIYDRYKEEMGNSVILSNQPGVAGTQRMGDDVGRGMFANNAFMGKVLNTNGDMNAMEQYFSAAQQSITQRKDKELNDLGAKIGPWKVEYYGDKEAEDNYKRQFEQISAHYAEEQANLRRAAQNVAARKAVNSRIEKLGASRLSELNPFDIGLDVDQQLGNSAAVDRIKKRLAAGKDLDPDTKVRYELLGMQALKTAQTDQFAQDRLPVVKTIQDQTADYQKKVLDNNPKYVKQQRILALSTAIYKDKNAVHSFLSDNAPSQEDINKAAAQFGWSKKDIEDITPDDIQSPKVWYKQALGSFITNTAGGLFKLGVSGVANAKAKLEGGHVDEEALSDWENHFDKDNFAQKLLIGETPQGAGLFDNDTRVSTDKGSDQYLMNVPNPHAAKFTWDPRAVINQVASGYGQMMGFGYGGKILGNLYKGGKLLTMGAEARSIAGDAKIAAELTGHVPSIDLQLGAVLDNAGQIGKLNRQAEIFGTLTSTYLTQHAANYQDVVNTLGTDPKDEGIRTVYSLVKDLGSGVTELINPDSRVVDNLFSPTSSTGRELINILRTKGVNGLERGTLKDLVLRGLKEGVVDTHKEVGEDLLNNLSDMVADAVFAPDKFKTTDYIEQQKQTYITSAISSALPVMGGSFRQVQQQSRLQKSMLYEVGSNPGAYLEDIMKGVTENKYDQAEANKRIQIVNTLSDIVEKDVPNESPVNGQPLTPAQKMDYTSNLLNERMLTAHAKTIDDEVQQKNIEKKVTALKEERELILHSAGERVIYNAPDEIDRLENSPNINNNESTSTAEPAATQSPSGQENEQPNQGLSGGQNTANQNEQGSVLNNRGVDMRDPSINPYGFEDEKTTTNGKSDQQAQQESGTQGSNDQRLPANIGEQQPAQGEAAQPRTDGGNSTVSSEGRQESASQAPAAQQEVRPAPTAVSFTTSKGSVYAVQADGTTIRDKSDHPEHGGDAGIKPQSSQTVYVTKEDLRKLDLVQATPANEKEKFTIAHLPDGQVAVGVITADQKGRHGQYVGRTVVQAEQQPAVGLYPVETFAGETQPHFGNEITSVVPVANATNSNQNSSPQTTNNETAANSEGNRKGEAQQSPESIIEPNAKAGDSTEAKPKGKKFGIGLRYERAGQLETSVPYQRVMQYFSGVGKIGESAIASLFRNAGEEVKLRKWMIQDPATATKFTPQTIDDLAHSLWEDHTDHFGDQDGTTAMDYKEAIESVITNYSKKRAIVDELYDQHPDTIAEREMKAWAEEHQAEQTQYGQSFQDAVDILTNMSEADMDKLIAEHEAGNEAYVQQVIAEHEAEKPTPTNDPEFDLRLAESESAAKAALRKLNAKQSSLARLNTKAAQIARALQVGIFDDQNSETPVDSAALQKQSGEINVAMAKATKAIDAARAEVRTTQEALRTVQDANPLAAEIFSGPAGDQLSAADNAVVEKEFTPEQLTGIDQFIRDNSDADGNLNQAAVDALVDHGEELFHAAAGDSRLFIDNLTDAVANQKQDGQQGTEAVSAEPAVPGDQSGSTNEGQPGTNTPEATKSADIGPVIEDKEPGGEGIQPPAGQPGISVAPTAPAIEKPVPTGDKHTDAVNEYNYRRHVVETKQRRMEIAEEHNQPVSDRDKEALKIAQKKLTDSIRALKIKSTNLALTTPAVIPVVLWNAAVEIVALSLEGGFKLREAINAGVDYIQKRHFTKWDERAFRNKMGENDIYEMTPDEIRQLKEDHISLSQKNKQAADGLVNAVRNNTESLSTAIAHINALKGLSQPVKDKIIKYIKAYVEEEVYKAQGRAMAEQALSDHGGDYALANQEMTDELEMKILASTSDIEKENLKGINAAARAHLNSLETTARVKDGSLTPNYGNQATEGVQQGETFGLPDRTMKDKAQEYGQDRLARLETAQKHSIQEITPQLDAVTAMRLKKSISHYLLEQVWSYIGNKEKKAGTFFDRLQKAGLDVRKLGLYQYALHAPERNAYNAENRQKLFDAKLYELEKAKNEALDAKEVTALEAQINQIKNQQDPRFSLMPDGGSGMTNQQAQEVLDEMKAEGTLDQYKTFADEYRTNVIDKILDYKYDAGIISENDYNHLKSFYEHYVPLKVDMTDEEENSKDRRMFKSTGMSGRDIYRSRGSVDRTFDQRNNPMLQSMVDLEKTITKSVENKANIKLANLVRANPNDNIWKIQTAQFETTADQQGNVYRVNEINRPQYAIAFYENGTKKYIMLFDRGLQNLIRSMGDPKIERLIGAPSRLLTAVNTLYNPEFLVKNALFDLGDAFLSTLGDKNKEVSKRFAKYAVKAPSVISQMVFAGKNNEWKKWVEDWQANGGEISFLNQATVDENAEKSLKMFEQYGKKFGREELKKPLHALKVVQGSIEQMTRVMVYRSAVESGIAKDKAANIARNATLDFEKKGVYGTYINAFKAFANAGIQGATNVAWLAKSSKRVRQFLGFMVLSGIAEGLINEMFGGCDDDKKEGCWWEVPEFQKQKNFMIPLGPGHTPLSVPIGRQFAWFNYLGKNIYAAIRGHQDAGEFTSNTFRSLLGFYNPVGGDAPISQQLAGNFSPIVALQSNTNNFGVPITPVRENIPLHDNYWPKTGKGYVEAAKFMSEATGGGAAREGAIEVSPNQLKFIMQSGFGGVYNFLMDAGNDVHNATSGEPVKNKEIPFVRIFSRESDMAITKGKFYDAVNFSQRNLMTEAEKTQFEQYADALVKGGVISEDSKEKTMNFVDRNQSGLEKRAEDKQEEQK